MPGSVTASLDSLSSPSPSPPPLDNRPPASTSNHSRAAGLDSGSELSELTEDEQENENDRGEDTDNPSRSSRHGKRGIVPAPMWDWAYKTATKKADWRTRPTEEEEEEDHSGPATAMDEEDDDREIETKPGALVRRETDRSADVDVDENEDDEELREQDNDDEGHESEDDVFPHTVAEKPADDPGSGSDMDEEDGESEVEVDPQATVRSRNAPSLDLTDDENAEVDDAEDEDEEMVDNDTPTIPHGIEDAESEDETEVVGDAELSFPVDVVLPTVPSAQLMDVTTHAADQETETAMNVDVDETMPPPIVVSPIIAIASSSIMAGTAAVGPPSPSNSSASGSPTSSRSPSLEPEPEPISDHETERKSGGSRANRNRRTKGARSARTRAARRTKAEAAQEQDAGDDGDQVAATEGDIPDSADVEDIDVDLEMESDLQPAHRAEALDVLATIELKFALLRERLYIEKMETLAWEESLITQDTHPELLHLHAELSKRRDKRLELASRRREYESANVTKRRKLDEDGVWSWWKAARDDLQSEMITETNRQRRKMERERRAIDRPQPVRRIPDPPRDIPPPQSLRDMVKAYPYGLSSRHRPNPKDPSAVYPQLSTLSPAEITRDVDFLYQHRRQAASFDPHRGHNPAFGHVYDQFSMGTMEGLDMMTWLQHQHALHSQMQAQPQPQMIPGPGSRPTLAHSASGSMSHQFHPMSMEQDMAHMPRPDPHVYGAGPGPGMVNLMRRSISPVSVQTLNGSGTGMSGFSGPGGFGGAKPHGWGPGGGPSAGANDSKGLYLGAPNSETDVREQQKRFPDSLKARSRGDRDWDRELEGDVDRVQHFQSHQPPHSSRSHSHHHVHVGLVHTGLTHTTPGHTGPAHIGLTHTAPAHAAHLVAPHHHHHHHVHHHHPPTQGSNGINGQLQAGQVGESGPNLSPHDVREIESRRPNSGTPMEIIDLSSSTKPLTPSNAISPFCKGNNDPPQLSSENVRERGKPSIGSTDHLVSPFVMTPTQAILANLSGSPKNMPGPSTAPASVVHSRRGSWSASDDNGVLRPSSSLSHSGLNHPVQNSNGSGLHRHSNSSSGPILGPTHHGMPTHHNPLGGLSPRGKDSRPIAPLSPTSNFVGPRSPRLPLPPYIAVPNPQQVRPSSPVNLGSPSLQAIRQNTPLLPRTISPSIGPPTNPDSGSNPAPGPRIRAPSPSLHSTAIPSRLTNVEGLPDKRLPRMDVPVKVGPVEGSS